MKNKTSKQEQLNYAFAQGFIIALGIILIIEILYKL